MTTFLLVAAVLVLLLVAVALLRLLWGAGDVDRMLAAQLLGTGGIAALLLFGAATGGHPAIDVALVLALLATFASMAFAKGAAEPRPPAFAKGAAERR